MKSGLRVLFVLVALFAQACGAAGEDLPPGPTVADARFGGTFVLGAMSVGGDQQEPEGPIEFDIDAEFGALSITGPCGTSLGSFSFFDDGRAGVTISGGSRANCSARAEDQREDLLAVLGRISEWTETTAGFELRSAEADSLALVG